MAIVRNGDEHTAVVCRWILAPRNLFFPSQRGLFLGRGPQVHPAGLVSCLQCPCNPDGAQCGGWTSGLLAGLFYRLPGHLDRLQEVQVCQPGPSHWSVGTWAGYGIFEGGGVSGRYFGAGISGKSLWIFLGMFRILGRVSGDSLKAL